MSPNSNINTSFLLLNSEIHNDTFLSGFEFYAATNGTINIKIVSLDSCGTLSPCAVYFTQNPFNKTMNIIYEWDYDISLGYNKLILPQPLVVYRGNYIYLTQTTGKIAIDQTGNSTYSDLVWNSTTKWTKLSEFSNWRFYLNALTNFSSYESKLNVIHSYSNIGVYTLNITFPSSNKTFTQIVNVTDCKSYFFV